VALKENNIELLITNKLLQKDIQADSLDHVLEQIVQTLLLLKMNQPVQVVQQMKRNYKA